MKRSFNLSAALVLLLTGAAFAVRLAYLLHSHPFIDEFTTVLATRAILERGLPVLPSGLFYEHGLLFSYLDVPFVWLAGEGVSFTIARLPSLLVGTATVPILYWVGRRWFSSRVGLVAAALLAFSPEGMVWGGRARMYALAQLLVLLLVFFAYEGSRGTGRPRPRWLALLILLATLLTQFGAMILILPLVIGSLVVGWLTRPDGVRPWFLRRAALAEGAVLAVVIGVGVLVKRLGRPLGAAPLGDGGAVNPWLELWRTITYQAGLALDGASTVEFLARQFGVSHHLWLTFVAIVGGLLSFAVWLSARESANQQISKSSYSLFYLWLVFGLTVLEMVTLLEPWRRNPRYLVMVLPWFYLIVAGPISNLKSAILFVFVVVQAVLLVPDLRVAYLTPEPAYEDAFQYVADQWRPGDILLTMNTSAAGLYLGHADYSPQETYRFAVQDDAEQFLLNLDMEPVDRWLGAPWIGTAADFDRTLDEHPRTWFVVDTIRLPVYYRGDWLALLKTQMDLVWSEDEALVYRTRPDRVPLSTVPRVAVNADLGGSIRLVGYDDVAREPLDPSAGSPTEYPGDVYPLTLFWTPLAPIREDYTVFVHVRDAAGATVAQRDSQPLGGDYPTSRWRVGETVIDPYPIELPSDLPPGEYQVWVGMYRLETLERLPVADDTSGENAVALGQVTLR